MRNFRRAVRLALKQRLTLAGIVASSLIVATLWGANIGTVYPLIEVVFNDQNMHDWIDGKIKEAESNCDAFRTEIEQLKQNRGGSQPLQKRHRLDLQISRQESRLAAEQKALATAQYFQPFIQKYLPESPFQTLLLIVCFVLTATMTKTVLLVTNMVLVERIGQITALELRNQFYRRTLQMDMGAFGSNRTGDLMSRMQGDIGAVAAGISILLGKSIREPFKMLACIAGAAYISWRLMLVSLIVCPLAVVLMYYLAQSIKRANRRAMEESAILCGRLSETLNGIQVVKAFTMERVERGKFLQTTRKLYLSAIKIKFYNSLTRLNNEILGVGIICMAILVGGYLVLNQQTHLLGLKITDRPLSFGSLLLFFGFLIGMSDPVRKLSDVFNALQRAAAGADRIYLLLDRDPTILDPNHPQTLPNGPQELTFENVSFQYTSDRNQTLQQNVLNNINLTIRPGECLAIVGPNGCGKSTLVNLILRFYDPDQGAVRLGGVDLRDLRVRDLRNHVGPVSQQTLLFDDTVANNIRYGSVHATDEDVVNAAKQAHAHSFIEKELDHGYQTHVGERGNSLSGGQRQRIALARAILRNPAVLILDEATSQIDPESEQLIHQALEGFIEDRTTIMITHRKSTLHLADRIVVMDAGEIVDVGSHARLLENSELYNRLFHFQFKKSA